MFGLRRMGGICLLLALGTAMVACGGSSTSSSSSSGQGPSGLTVNSFNSSFSEMTKFKSLASAGKGLVGVILPDTQSSARYVDFDAPYLTKAFQAAGFSKFKIDNAQGSDATELNLAQADITDGASVLLVDPLDPGVGATIESYAKGHGVAVIDYDRITLGGSRQYYISFNNVQVGKLIGQGEVSCIQSWNVQSPHVFELDGAPTDNNATLFAQGYNSVLGPMFSNSTYTKVGEEAVPAWNNDQALTIFQQQFTAHKDINAVVAANDGLGNSVISALKSASIPAKKVPTTGQDATLQGMKNILEGYQCMSVYKPIYLQAQGAVALAFYLRAKQTPPAGLVNGTTQDTQANTAVKSVLLTPLSVNGSNMESTVIKDKFIDVAALCSQVGASVCSQNGIS
jgi:D-xylose transport system substrate-binding protein